MPSAVTIKRLKKVVVGKSILKSIDLAVRPGEFLTLVGPSGSGKSTLLRVISGLTEFTSGSVLIDDKEVSELAPRERGVAMVFQSYALYPHMSSRRQTISKPQARALRRLYWLSGLTVAPMPTMPGRSRVRAASSSFRCRPLPR